MTQAELSEQETIPDAPVIPALRIENLGVGPKSKPILRGVNALIAPGEFLGVLGPNGGGKSTLLRAILGLCPIEGRIEIFGQPPGRANRRVGYMPQDRSGLENTALSARSLVGAVCRGERWGVPWLDSSARAEVERVLALAGALDYADRPFSVLSGGERQRVCLAQALLGDPRLLLLDEPLASLDPKNQLLLVKQISSICRETGATVLFVAHDVNPLLHEMDRVLYVAGGGAAVGSVHEVISSASLSALYGMEIHVVKAEGHIFIINAEGNVIETARHG